MNYPWKKNTGRRGNRQAHKSGNCTFQHLTGCIHQENRQSIQESRFKVITYRKSRCHYFDVLRFINKYFDNGKTSRIRVAEEIHIASAVPCIIHSNDTPICICSKEEYCIAEYGEGLYEAEYSGVGTPEEHILQEYDVTSPAIPMTDLELYWEFLPKALFIWYSSVIGQISSFAFLDCLPFKVLAGYTLENHIRECSCLCNFHSFPLRRSVTFPGDGESYFMEIDSRRFTIPLKDYLGYPPETIEIIIDISYFLCDIIIKDVKYKKQVKIPLIELISNSYTEEDTLKTKINKLQWIRQPTFCISIHAMSFLDWTFPRLYI